MYKLIIILCLISGKYFSQVLPLDTLVVNVSDLVFKKDTSVNSNSFFHVKINIQPIARLQTLKISFLNHVDTIVGSTDTYTAVAHAKGFYYIESPSHKKIIAHGSNLDFILPFTTSEYIEYEKVKISYVSESGIVQHKVFIILKQ